MTTDPVSDLCDCGHAPGRHPKRMFSRVVRRAECFDCSCLAYNVSPGREERDIGLQSSLPVSGTTDEALAELQRVDPERHAEITRSSHAPTGCTCGHAGGDKPYRAFHADDCPNRIDAPRSVSEFEDTEAGRREAAEFVTTTLETVVAENRELRERVNALIDNADRFFVDLHADAINQLAASMKRVAELEGRDGAFAKRFPGEVDRIGTHYDDCYRQHPACAYLLAIHDMKEADRA